MQDALRLALAQIPLVWEDPEANFSHIERVLSIEAHSWDLLILPEMFSTGFTMTPGNLPAEVGERTWEWMKDLSRRTQGAIMGSTVFHTPEGYVNRMLLAQPGSDHMEYYDKRHLFTLAGEHRSYVAGNRRPVFEYKGFRIFPQICYDLRFPVWSRNDLDYDLLIYVANWPVTRIQAWDALLKARAIENMAYSAGINRVGSDQGGYQYPGHSTLVDPLGNATDISEREEILYGSISKKVLLDIRERLRFLNDRDVFRLEDAN